METSQAVRPLLRLGDRLGLVGHVAAGAVPNAGFCPRSDARLQASARHFDRRAAVPEVGDRGGGKDFLAADAAPGVLLDGHGALATW